MHHGDMVFLHAVQRQAHGQREREIERGEYRERTNAYIDVECRRAFAWHGSLGCYGYVPGSRGTQTERQRKRDDSRRVQRKNTGRAAEQQTGDAYVCSLFSRETAGLGSGLLCRSSSLVD